jgi:hypothetical protein
MRAPHRPNRRRSWGAALTKTTFGKNEVFRFYQQKNATPRAKKRFFAHDDDPTLGI